MRQRKTKEGEGGKETVKGRMRGNEIVVLVKKQS
jgi:hypothetical protein